MAESRSIRSVALVLALVLAGAALLVGSAVALAATAHHRSAKVHRARAHAAAAPRLTGWLAGGIRFPHRAIILEPPVHGTLTPSAITLRENGAPVTGFDLRSLAAGGPGDFGTVVAIDQSSTMSGAGLASAMSAVRTLASARVGAQQLGVVTFDQTPSRYLPLSASGPSIAHVLAATPWTGPGADVSAAEALALRELTAARLAAGLVIVISDGAGTSSPSTAAAALRATAEADHIPIVTIGLADAHSTAAMFRALAAQAPGQFFSTQPAGLASLLATVEHRAQVGDVVRWRSAAPGGQTASIDLSVRGLAGAVAASVADPQLARPAAAPSPPVAPPHPTRPAAPRNPRAGLSFSASFAPRGTLQSSPAFPATGPAPVANPAPAPAPVATPGFWGSDAAVLVVSLACGLLAAIVVLLILRRPSHRAVRLRVGSFVPAERGDEDPILVLPTEARPHGPLSMLARSNWWPLFVEAVEVSRSEHTPGALVKRAAAAGMVLAVVSTLVLGTILPGVFCLLGWPFALRMFVNRAAGKQREKFRDALPVYLQDLASAIRVGRSLVAGLSVLAESAEEPMRTELERAVTDEALGRPLEESLELVAKRMRSTDMDQVALIAALNRRSGSNIAEALDRVAEGARERADLRREIKALTAQAKMSSIVLTALPGVLLAGLSVISPKYSYPLFHTTMGIVALSVGGCLVIGGWKVMQKITRVEA